METGEISDKLGRGRHIDAPRRTHPFVAEALTEILQDSLFGIV